MFCPACGSPNEDGVKFCAKCGSSLTNSKANRPASEVAPSDSIEQHATSSETYTPPQAAPQQQYAAPVNASGSTPGKTMAIISLVCGIVGVVLWFFGYSAIISFILGVVGVILARKSAQQGFNGGLRTAGMVLSMISVVGGLIIFIAVVACVACGAASLGMLGSSF